MSIKNKVIKNHWNFLLALLIFLFIGLACDGGVSLTGQVLDENGNPINEAKILLIVGEKKMEEKSRKDGSYNIGGVVSPYKNKTTLTVSKEGFQTFEQSFDSQEEVGRKRDIVLKKN